MQATKNARTRRTSQTNVYGNVFFASMQSARTHTLQKNTFLKFQKTCTLRMCRRHAFLQHCVKTNQENTCAFLVFFDSYFLCVKKNRTKQLSRMSRSCHVKFRSKFYQYVEGRGASRAQNTKTKLANETNSEKNQRNRNAVLVKPTDII